MPAGIFPTPGSKTAHPATSSRYGRPFAATDFPEQPLLEQRRAPGLHSLPGQLLSWLGSKSLRCISCSKRHLCLGAGPQDLAHVVRPRIELLDPAQLLWGRSDLDRGLEACHSRAYPLVADQCDPGGPEIVSGFRPALAGLVEAQLEAHVRVRPLDRREVQHGVHLPLAGFRSVAVSFVVSSMMHPQLSYAAPRQRSDPRHHLGPALFLLLVTRYQAHDVVEHQQIEPA